MKKRGRKVNIEKVNLCKQLRAEGKSYRQIAQLLNCDVKSICRWVNYGVG